MKTILLVEDDQWIRSLLRELLVDEGYRVVEASSGDEAVRMVDTHHPDLVLLDLRLPRKSGLEILRELRANDETASLPVLVMSGELNDRTRKALAGKTQRADAVFEKPLDLGEVFKRVDQVLSRQPSIASK
ncbi:MAG: response regulator [Chloroflexi bacterium]|nr:response regulator [Chloroflexota bacterium]